MELLLVPLFYLISIPGGAFAPALALAACVGAHWKRTPRPWRAAGAACAVLWIVYAVYETRMYFWMQTVIAPIRVDLLLLAPLLYLTAIVGVVACTRRAPRSPAR